jgi:hypothetical protein
MRKTFWKKLFTRDLKLMVDYNIDPHVVGDLNKLGAVKAKTTIAYGFQQHAEDRVLVYKGTNECRCVLLTRDKRTINEREFPPCGHGGIIIIKAPRPSKEKVFACIKAFCQSGHRSKASHNVIHLWEDRAVIHKHNGVKEEVRL